MSSLEQSADAAPLLVKPCLGCRSRKIRCDKLRPCTPCSRSRRQCTYDGDDSIADDVEGDARSSNLRDRLVKLEEMMALMMREREHRTLNEGDGTKETDPASLSTQNQRPSSIPEVYSSLFLVKSSPIGQIVYQEGEGAYFRNDFWLGLVPEVGDNFKATRMKQTKHEPD